jgi:hypothetical protein
MAVATRNFGAPIRRNEDARLLSGQAIFLDDVELFLRSVVPPIALLACPALPRLTPAAAAPAAWRC